MKRKTSSLIAVLALSGLLLIGCSGLQSPSSSSTLPATTTSTNRPYPIEQHDPARPVTTIPPLSMR